MVSSKQLTVVNELSLITIITLHVNYSAHKILINKNVNYYINKHFGGKNSNKM